MVIVGRENLQRKAKSNILVLLFMRLALFDQLKSGNNVHNNFIRPSNELWMNIYGSNHSSLQAWTEIRIVAREMFNSRMVEHALKLQEAGK